MPAPSRPNLLLITTDQQRWDALSLLGSPGYHTPHLDQLAQRGVSFDQAYVPTPVCTPCRVSMLTGLYPPRHGAYQIGMQPAPALERDTLPILLGKQGYKTACIGKTHFVARALEAAHVAGLPLDAEVPQEFWENFDGPYLGFHFIRHNGAHTCNSPPEGHYRRWLKEKGANLDDIDALHLPKLPREKGAMPVGRWDLPEEYHHTAYVTDEAMRWIDAQDGEPWFAMLNYQDPHAPFVCPDPYYSEVEMRDVPMPAFQPGEMDDKPPFYRSFIEQGQYLDETGQPLQDHHRIASLFRYDFGEQTRDAIRAYIGMVNMLDTYIGRLLGHLEQRGQLENTLICFVSDHGEQLGRHGLWEKGICAYDDAQRVPAILSWPAADLPERGRVPHHFNIVDILPTFLSAAGIETPVGVQGFDHLPYLSGNGGAVRDWSFVDFYTSSKLHQQTLVTNEWKLVLYRQQKWGELYHRPTDPDQFHNLYEDPAHAAVRAELTHRMVQVQMELSGVQVERSHYA